MVWIAFMFFNGDNGYKALLKKGGANIAPEEGD